MKMTSSLPLNILAGLVSLAFATPASAAVTMNFVETVTGVTATFNGSLDLTGLTSFGIGGGEPNIQPDIGRFVFNIELIHNSSLYSTSAVPASFGSGGLTVTTTNSGHVFGITPLTPTEAFVFVPVGYVSGSPLSGTATFSGATLASLGIGSGPFVTTFGNGDTITIMATTIPEPSAFALVFTGLGMLGLVARRR
jgi:hypothetical protein